MFVSSLVFGTYLPHARQDVERLVREVEYSVRKGATEEAVTQADRGVLQGLVDLKTAEVSALRKAAEVLARRVGTGSTQHDEKNGLASI